MNKEFTFDILLSPDSFALRLTCPIPFNTKIQKLFFEMAKLALPIVIIQLERQRYIVVTEESHPRGVFNYENNSEVLMLGIQNLMFVPEKDSDFYNYLKASLTEIFRFWVIYAKNNKVHLAKPYLQSLKDFK